jgi:hypothetical protein
MRGSLLKVWKEFIYAERIDGLPYIVLKDEILVVLDASEVDQMVPAPKILVMSSRGLCHITTYGTCDITDE